MTLADAIKYFGTQYKMMKAMGMSQSSVTYWKEKNKIPLLSQLKLQKLTNGELVADEIL